MQGYWNEPERTAEAIDADGWMHTGDLAVMADDGYVSIVGRIKDMVIRGGENVYPREIEEFLYTHPDVADVQVIGVPDPRYGEELMAWVKLIPARSTPTSCAVLPRQDRPLQDPPLRPLRRRVPDDRHRQGAEVRDARESIADLGASLPQPKRPSIYSRRAVRVEHRVRGTTRTAIGTASTRQWRGRRGPRRRQGTNLKPCPENPAATETTPSLLGR